MMNKRNWGKKGLATGIIALVLFMFVFALMSLLALTLWDNFEAGINSIDNSTIDQTVKDQIHTLRSKLLWGDTLFVFMFIALLISYLISSVTIPTDNPEYLFVFMILLILTCVVAMIISNSWAYMIAQPDFVTAATELPFTTYFIKYYPIFTFLIGVIGAAIFYGRRNKESSSFGGQGGIGGNAIE